MTMATDIWARADPRHHLPAGSSWALFSIKALDDESPFAGDDLRIRRPRLSNALLQLTRRFLPRRLTPNS
jgi:hypothetical protein